jgi:hypothetical protein
MTMDDIDLLGYALAEGDGLEGELLGAPFDYAVELGRGRVPARRSGAARANALIQRFSPVNGVQQRGLRDLYLGWALFTFSSTSGTILTQLTRPQRPFCPRRIVIDIVRTGASATGLVTISNLQVGDRPQSIGEAGSQVPAAAFGPGAFQTVLNLDRADPGVSIGLSLQITAAPTTTDTVVCAAMLIGHSVG